MKSLNQKSNDVGSTLTDKINRFHDIVNFFQPDFAKYTQSEDKNKNMHVSIIKLVERLGD